MISVVVSGGGHRNALMMIYEAAPAAAPTTPAPQQNGRRLSAAGHLVGLAQVRGRPLWWRLAALADRFE
jgi:hypothetical protein